MSTHRLVIFILTFTFLTGCQYLRNKGVGLGENNTVTAYNNLDRQGSIALFNSLEGQSCYNTIKEAITSSLNPSNPIEDYQNSPQFVGAPKPPKPTTEFDALIEQSKAMADLAKALMKNAADMVAYSNNITPQDPIVQLAALCKRNNYYDMQMAKSENRHETAQKIFSDIKDALVGVTPYAALAYVGSKVGDRNSVRGDNNAYGDRNAVADPTVLDPTVIADGENISTPPLPEDPNVIPEDPNVIPFDPNL